jgi:ERCC4-related helicase
LRTSSFILEMSNEMFKAMNQNMHLRFLKEHKLESRKYQMDIARKCAHANSLVVIPTGLGKTIISLLVVAEVLDSFPTGSKVIMLAPTRPLITQHHESFREFLTIPSEKMTELMGNVASNKRPQLFKESQILFFTPQTLRNDLVAGRYGLKDTCLIIFDEAHHASGDYPYGYISDAFVEQNPDGIILALTASPGSSQERIDELCETLHINKQNVYVRTRDDADVKRYLKPMDIYKIGADMTELMQDACLITKQLIEERLLYLIRFGFLDETGENLVAKINRKKLVELNTELVAKASPVGKESNIYAAISVNAQALIMYHILELIEQQGLDALLLYLEKLFKDASKKNSSKANRILASDRRIRRMRLELQKHQSECPEVLIHPKLRILKKLLLEQITKVPHSRILVFVKLRDSVLNIVSYLKNYPLIKAQRFVGQATKSKKDKGISQTKQLQILEEFKNGTVNVLIATNVAEEGLDIAECDVVVFYDIVASEIRYIQRKGRTARKKEGRVVLLYTRNTNDEIYLRIALTKLKRMNTNLRNGVKEEDHANILSTVKKKSKALANMTPKGTKPSQPTLISFIQSNDSGSNDDRSFEGPPDIILSLDVPGKFGVRKFLREEGVNFTMKGKGMMISFYRKALLKLLDPKESTEKYFNLHNQKYELTLFVYDFEEFFEKFEGEKRLLKQKLTRKGEQQGFTVICIDFPEELTFILKSIITNHREGEKS